MSGALWQLKKLEKQVHSGAEEKPPTALYFTPHSHSGLKRIAISREYEEFFQALGASPGALLVFWLMAR